MYGVSVDFIECHLLEPVGLSGHSSSQTEQDHWGRVVSLHQCPHARQRPVCKRASTHCLCFLWIEDQSETRLQLQWLESPRSSFCTAMRARQATQERSSCFGPISSCLQIYGAASSSNAKLTLSHEPLSSCACHPASQLMGMESASHVEVCAAIWQLQICTNPCAQGDRAGPCRTTAVRDVLRECYAAVGLMARHLQAPLAGLQQSNGLCTEEAEGVDTLWLWFLSDTACKS